jgi:hypothetical protein
MVNAILVWYEPHCNPIYWKLGNVNFYLCREEISKYNEWIENVLVPGLAPSSSYSEDAHGCGYVRDLFLIHNPGYFEFESLEPTSIEQFLYDIKRHSYGFYLTKEEKFHKHEKNPESAKFRDLQSLEELVVTPWNIYGNFTLGYKLLPLFQQLISCVS